MVKIFKSRLRQFEIHIYIWPNVKMNYIMLTLKMLSCLILAYNFLNRNIKKTILIEMYLSISLCYIRTSDAEFSRFSLL